MFFLRHRHKARAFSDALKRKQEKDDARFTAMHTATPAITRRNTLMALRSIVVLRLRWIRVSAVEAQFLSAFPAFPSFSPSALKNRMLHGEERA